MGRALRIIIIVTLVALQLVAGGVPAFMMEGPYMLRASVYSFFHANLFHLAVNCIAVWSVFAPGRRNACGNLFLSYLVAVLVYPLSFRPVIGFSNILYCMLGLRVPPFSSSWWKTPNAIAFIIATVVMVVIPQLSATTHIAAFLCGMALSSIHRHYLRLTKDARRYYK